MKSPYHYSKSNPLGFHPPRERQHRDSMDYAMRGMTDTVKLGVTGSVGVGLITAAGGLIKK